MRPYNFFNLNYIKPIQCDIADTSTEYSYTNNDCNNDAVLNDSAVICEANEYDYVQDITTVDDGNDQLDQNRFCELILHYVLAHVSPLAHVSFIIQCNANTPWRQTPWTAVRKSEAKRS